MMWMHHTFLSKGGIYEEKEKNRLFHNGGCASMQSD